MSTKFFTKSNIISISICSILLLAFMISGIVFLVNRQGVRRSFVFASVESGEYNVENRYIPHNPNKDDVTYYVEEILLGPQTERTKMMFTSGTKVLSCINKDGTLYVNLSADLLQMGNSVMEIRDGMELLKTNILRNFKEISKVEIFVDGNYAFENLD